MNVKTKIHESKLMFLCHKTYIPFLVPPNPPSTTKHHLPSCATSSNTYPFAPTHVTSWGTGAKKMKTPTSVVTFQGLLRP